MFFVERRGFPWSEIVGVYVVPVKGGMIIDHPRYKKLIDPGTFIEPKNWWVGSMCFLLFYYYFFFRVQFGSLFFYFFKSTPIPGLHVFRRRIWIPHKCKIDEISTFPAKGHELKDIMIFTLFPKILQNTL